MFRRWAETRMFRKTMRLAVSELRRAARTANALEKLQALDNAEQKLKDALWLSPSEDQGRFEAGLAEIARSRTRTLAEAIPAVERLLEAVGKGVGDSEELLRAAGQLLSFLNHYLPDDPNVERASAQFVQKGGEQPAYTPVRPLSDVYHRPEAGAGCGAVITVFLLLTVIFAAGLYHHHCAPGDGWNAACSPEAAPVATHVLLSKSSVLMRILSGSEE